jgi:VCBS repeat-containing protein
VNEDGSLSVTAANGVLANDTDPDGDPLTAAVVQGPANGALTLNADGSFAYVPKANFSGTDSFTYRANDGSANSAPTTVTINVTPVNDAPVAVANSYALNEDGTLNVAAASGVLANDSDVDNAQLTASLVSGPTHGTLTMNADGSFVYKPNANFNGTDSFVYRASDGSLSSAPATVTISVAPVNDAPDAVDDGQFQTAYNSAFSRTAAQLLANDSDADGNSLSILSVAAMFSTQRLTSNFRHVNPVRRSNNA